MSFYDDASLVFLPSGGAGKDGKAYSIKPVPEYGTELVTNGGFDTDSDWNLTSGGTDANISNGKANFVNAVKGQRIQQNFSFTAAKTYKVVFTVSNYTSGLLGFYMGGVYAVSNINANGTYTYLVTPTNNAEAFLRAMQTGVSHNFSVDDISVREVVVGNGDFTFSRGSNLTATRVDSNGLIEKGRENLLLQSNSFDTTWTLSSTSVTSGQSGYDGSSDAWLLSKSSANARIRQDISASGVQTFSVYAKAGTSSWVRIVANTASFQGGYFDLSNGVTGDIENAIDTNIEDIGLGWYRCSVLFNGSTTRVRIYPSEANSSSASSGSIYIQDAQLEQSLVATEYIESGASTGLAGILEDSPRFDYSGGASCPSLLLEGSRTNLIGQSEYKASGDFTNSTPSYNAASSPEGLQNATEMFDNSTNGQHRVAIGSFAVTSGTDYTISAFVKNNDIGYCYLLLEGGFTQTRYYFNLSTGQPITSGLEVENFADGWYRIYVTQSAAASGTGSVYLNMSNNGASPIYVGSGQSLFYYGFQAEQGSYPTSYIPNHSGGSETRSADSCSKTSVSSLIGQTEGTVYCDFEYNGVADSGVFNRIISLGTGTTQNRITLVKNDTTAELLVFVVSGGSTQVSQVISGTSIIGHHKLALSYKLNEYKVYLDGQLEFTDTTALVPSTTDIYIGTAEDGTANSELGGVVNQSIIYKNTLSENDCKALTAL